MAQNKRDAIVRQIIVLKIECFDLIEEMDALKDRFTKANDRNLKAHREIEALKTQLKQLPIPKAPENKDGPKT